MGSNSKTLLLWSLPSGIPQNILQRVLEENEVADTQPSSVPEEKQLPSSMQKPSFNDWVSLRAFIHKHPVDMHQDEFVVYKRCLYYYLICLKGYEEHEANEYIFTKANLNSRSDINRALKLFDHSEYIPIQRCMIHCGYIKNKK